MMTLGQLLTLSEYLTIDEKMIKLAMHIGLSRRQPNKPIRDGLQASRASLGTLPLPRVTHPLTTSTTCPTTGLCALRLQGQLGLLHLA